MPGGKGANQALAAARLGAQVRMVGAVGSDAFADEALALLRAGGVDLERGAPGAGPTGVALILVGADGENQIVVAPGANAQAGRAAGWKAPTPFSASSRSRSTAVGAAAEHAPFFCLNAAPARALPPELCSPPSTCSW